ncbi:hypothetical protein [Formosa haliotis]|uniref:hypothetical protein n=1 Tax=Formosa haliotis TaxID=1555194 RepID=UPI0008241ABF|nr:hypothetical protein [Formosa haliotis]
MNYIKHLNSIFKSFNRDSRLNTTHISLYMALFQYWNYNSFRTKIFISRQEIMEMSKIGSKTTYHRCLMNLNDWKYLQYLPSHNPYKGSEIIMFNFETTNKQVVNKQDESNKQALASILNLNKLNRNLNKGKLPKNEDEVILFFKLKKWPINEAKKFYNHNLAIGWIIGGKSKVENWKALASNWMIKAHEIEKNEAGQKLKDHLKTNKNKNYDQPL